MNIAIALMVVAIILYSVRFFMYLKRYKLKFPFNDTMGKVDLPIVSFTQNGKCFNFLIDSGASISVLNSTALSNIECIDIEGEQQIYGIDGSKIDVSLVGVKMYSHNHKFVEVFQVCDVPGLNNIREEYDLEVVGILGNSFLKRYSFIIDFARLTAYSNGNENKTKNT